MDLGVERWPVGPGPTDPPAAPPVAAEEGVPAWWGTGENADQFLLEQGVILQ